MANNPEWSEILRESVTVKLPEGRLVRYGLACVWPSAGTGAAVPLSGRSGRMPPHVRRQLRCALTGARFFVFCQSVAAGHCPAD